MPDTLGTLKNRRGGGGGRERHAEESTGLGDRLDVGRGSRGPPGFCLGSSRVEVP